MPSHSDQLSSARRDGGVATIDQVNQVLSELKPPMVLVRCSGLAYKMHLDEILARKYGMYFFFGTVHSDEHPKGESHYGAYDAQRHLLIGNPYLVLMLEPEDTREILKFRHIKNSSIADLFSCSDFFEPA